jgi:hypothetical protein
MAFPAYRYGPNEQRKLCMNEKDVPPGWVDSPKKARAAQHGKSAEDIELERMIAEEEAAKQAADAARGV